MLLYGGRAGHEEEGGGGELIVTMRKEGVGGWAEPSPRSGVYKRVPVGDRAIALLPSPRCA